ncbi:MAG: hypothetical protein JNK14_04585 [Chitinophagaceae bacterium]|nr:hypothetical protein [Chitinophagaceae bacterium]
MKRKIKDGTGLYVYLNSIGILTNGTDEEISKCKKMYWTKYRKEWKKNKRQQSKAYTMLFSFKEARAIAQKAEKLGITPTQFIKRCALSRHNFIGPVLTGQMREQIMLCTHNIETIMDEKRLPGQVTEEILTTAYKMEKAVLAILTPK